MKKVYEKPVMIAEEFSANECVTACGDSGTVYNFKCDAGSQRSKYNVYFDNGTPNDTSDDTAWTTNDDDWKQKLAPNREFGKSYQPCGTTHEANAKDDFLTGYMYKQFKGQDSGQPISVIVWTEGDTNTHCTTELDMTQWETAKS